MPDAAPSHYPILLLEDDADDASFVRCSLRKSNIANALIVCATADEARTELGRVDGEPHLALAIIDIYLPGKESGLDFLAWLRRQPPPIGDIPVMMFSVSTDPDHPIEAKALRSVLFLRKPATEAALSHGVQALGFVVTTTVAGDRTQRVIEPR